MTDIVERLRELSTWERRRHGVPADVAMDQAANDITRLRAENERLRAALRPFASIKADVGDGFRGLPDTVIVRIEASVRELKAARAALEEK